MASFRPETFTKIWDLGAKFAPYRTRETLGAAAKSRKCRRFPKKVEIYLRDRTGWLGWEDSNLRMAESKSSYFSFKANSNHTPGGRHGNFAPSHTTPCEALGEGIDLIVMAPGKSQ